MTTSVLAFIPSPAQGVWHLGPLPIRAYALCIITGIIAALIIGDRRWVDRGGEPGVIYDIALWAVPFGLVGGRLYHVMTDWRTYFSDGGAGIVGALKVWDGGLGIWGAVALGGVGAWIGCRRRGIPLPAFGDAVAPGVVLAQAIGRLGNYFNQELYGRPTQVPWGLEIFERRDASGALDTLNGVSTGQLVAVVHPTFLYELIWNVLVFAFLLWADRRFRLGHGRLFALYVAAYCIGRFGVELMRDDFATHIAGIRVNSFTSTFVFIGAVVYMMVAPKGREDPETLAGPDEILAIAPSAIDELGKELTVVAATSGVVAAASVAGAEEVEASAGGGEVADAADAVETQSDETEQLDPQATAAEEETAEPEAEVADEAQGEAAEPEGDAEPSAVGEPESDAETVTEVEAESEPEAEAADEAEPDALKAEEPAAEGDAEPHEAAEDETSEDKAEVEEGVADEAVAEPDANDDDPAEESEPAEDDGAEDTADQAESEAPEAETTEATDATDVGEADAAEDGDAAVVEPEKAEQPVAAASESRPLPAWEPMAPRRRWWQRQR